MLRFIARCWRGELEPPISARPWLVLLSAALVWMFFLFLVLPQFVFVRSPNPSTPEADLIAAPVIRSPEYGVYSANPVLFTGGGSERVPTGVTWNRWTLPWWQVEQVPGVYDWSLVDAAVRADLAQGLRPAVSLLGTPTVFATAVFG